MKKQNWKVPFYNSKSTFFPVDQSEIDPSQITNGEHVRRFEKKAADYLGVKYAVACSSGTIALFIAFRVLCSAFVGKMAIMPSFTWRSTPEACMMAGLKPLLADINKDSLCMDYDFFEKAINRIPLDRIAAVCIVDTFGNIPDYDRFNLEIPVIVDSAHSFGSISEQGRPFTHCFSLSPTKPLTSCEGGLVTTNDKRLAEKFTNMRNWAGRMTEFNALVALAGLEKIDSIIAEKNAIAEKYKNCLPAKFQEITCKKSSYKDFVVIFESGKSRDDKKKRLSLVDIETRIYFEPVHYYIFKNCEIRSNLHNTEEIYHRSLCLPCWPGCDVDYVVEKLQSFTLSSVAG